MARRQSQFHEKKKNFLIEIDTYLGGLYKDKVSWGGSID